VAAQAKAQFVQATAQLNAARAAGTSTAAVEAQRVALMRVSTAHVQARLAAEAHTLAMRNASIWARAAAAATTLWSNALKFFGGPIGLAIAAVMAAIGVAFLNAGRNARQAASEAKKAADDFKAALQGLDEATLRAQERVTTQRAGSTARALSEAQANLERLRALDRPEMTYRTQFTPGGDVQIPVITEHGRALAQAAQEITVLRTQANKAREAWLSVGEAINNASGAQVPALDLNGPGVLPWEGDDKDAKTAIELLQERVGLLLQVADAERATSGAAVTGAAAASSVTAELIRHYNMATESLSSMGDAARLSPEALKNYTDLLGIVTQIGERFAAPKLARLTIEVSPKMMGGGIGSDFAKQVSARLEAVANKFRETLLAAGNVPILDKMERLSSVIRENLKQGSDTAGDRLTEAANAIKGMWAGLLSGLPQQVQNFASMFRAIDERRNAQREAGEKITGLAPIPGAAAFAIAAEALAPILEALRGPFAALMVPIQILAQAFGPLLTSVVKAFFPIMVQFGIGLTYLAQVVGYVGGAIFKVVGEVIRTIGSLIAKVPGLGEEGAAIKKFGKGMTDASKEMFDLAKSMPGVREELRNLDWDEAMKRASDGANRLAESLTNIPPIFDYLARRSQAARGGNPTSLAPSTSSNAGVGSSSVVLQQTFAANSIVVHAQPHQNPEEIARQVVRMFERESTRGGPTPLSVAVTRLAKA
jgi:hypothetical protein